MPALGIGTPVFLVVQALIGAFVYREATRSGLSSPAFAGVSVFVGGVVLAFVFRAVVELVATEVLLILLYLVVQTVFDRRGSTA